MCSSGTESVVCSANGGGGGNSIQEFTAANPYNPPPRKTVGVRFGVSTHADRPPSVRRHRRRFLPKLSRVTAYALPGTDRREELAPPTCRFGTFGKQTVAQEGSPNRILPCVRSASDVVMPVSPFVVTQHIGTTQRASTVAHCLAGRPPDSPRRLPSTGSSASTQATLPSYGV